MSQKPFFIKPIDKIKHLTYFTKDQLRSEKRVKNLVFSRCTSLDR